MKNIIYGLGYAFMRYSQYWTDLLENSVALCDADESKKLKYSAGILGIPVITPDEICNYSFDKLYITSGNYYEEILADLTANYKVPAYKISFVKMPNLDMLFQLNKFVGENYSGPNIRINPKSFVKDVITLPSRETVLEFMPKNAVVTEIGVGNGYFTRHILDVMKPSKFFAIDWYNEENPDGLVKDLIIRDGFDNHKNWYEHRFCKEIQSGILETRQGLSWDELSKFPDDYFDYAYVDAGHDYDSIMKDMAILPSKMKNGGFIQFNDYTVGDIFYYQIYGVISSVNQFLNSGNHKIRYFCLHPTGFHDVVIQVEKDRVGY